MSDGESSHLRNRPRQARSAARVELLLDVAESVIEEIGYEATTTNLVASRAGVPVGTLYRWFPDKSALAEALADRYLANLTVVYADLMGSIEPAEHIGDFIRRVLGQLVEDTRELKAMPALLVSAMVPGGRSPAGNRLRAGLRESVVGLVDERLPGLPDHLRDRTAEICVTLTHLVLTAAADEDEQRAREYTDEYIDVMLAYLEAKFPSPQHPAWSDPEVAVKPLFPAPDRASRLAANSAG